MTATMHKGPFSDQKQFLDPMRQKRRPKAEVRQERPCRQQQSPTAPDMTHVKKRQRSRETSLPRYTEARRLASGATGFYYHPPQPAQAAGIVRSLALGHDRAEAIRRAKALNNRLDRWREDETVQGPPPAFGSLDWAIGRFRDLRERQPRRQGKPLSKRTSQGYDNVLDRLASLQLSRGRGPLGGVAMTQIAPRDAGAILEIFGRADASGHLQAPAAAAAAARICRRLWNLVGRRELGLKENPFSTATLRAAGFVEGNTTETLRPARPSRSRQSNPPMIENGANPHAPKAVDIGFPPPQGLRE